MSDIKCTTHHSACDCVTAGWLRQIADFRDEVIKHRMENQRFREALEDIADRPHEQHCAWLDPGPDTCNCWLAKARAALEGKE